MTLRRAAATGDPQAQKTLARAKQRACEHEWEHVGLFAPGFADVSSSHAGPGQVSVWVCFACDLSRSQSGERLCFWCSEPGGKKGLTEEMPDDEGEWCHASCAKEWKEEEFAL